jgi:NAD(P)H dehydrogenase (quinone)
MSAEPTYAITGATGTIGGRIARALAEAGVPQRLVVRDAWRAPTLPDAEVAVASYDDSDALREAFTGTSILFMVSAAEHPDRVSQHFRCVDAAVAAGVERIVYTSFFGAAPDATFTLGRDHWATEEHIRASGLTWTFLRDNLYADFVVHLPGEDGVIRGPADDGRVSLVAQADVAAVATRVLLEPGQHDEKTYGLSGPEALSLSEIAALMTSLLGKPISYVNETIDEAYASRAKYDAPGWQLDAWVSTYTSIANGEQDAVTDDVLLVTGHPAASLREVLGALG